jgi:hypothetical protein
LTLLRAMSTPSAVLSTDWQTALLCGEASCPESEAATQHAVVEMCRTLLVDYVDPKDVVAVEQESERVLAARVDRMLGNRLPTRFAPGFWADCVLSLYATDFQILRDVLVRAAGVSSATL